MSAITALNRLFIVWGLVLPAMALATPAEDFYLAHQQEDFAKALEIVRPLAEKGDAWAQANLAVMLDKGEGTPTDPVQGLQWHKRAVAQGNEMAQFNLGRIYQEGKVVGKDYAEAVKWYTLAAEQGNVFAQNNLGVIYKNGEGGITQDYTKALKWYQRAASQGYAWAQRNLGLMYYRGQGVERDDMRATMWLVIAASDNIRKRPVNQGIRSFDELADTRDLFTGQLGDMQLQAVTRMVRECMGMGLAGC